MRRLLTTLSLTLGLLAPAASADPLGSWLREHQLELAGIEASSPTRCKDLRRSTELRQRKSPSERRRLIEHCEREARRDRLAQTTPEPPAEE